MFDREQAWDEPRYVISVVARMVGLRPQTLRYYERLGLISPSRSEGARRLYSARDVERLRRIRTLIADMGVNLAGVEVILRLMDYIHTLEERVRALEAELERLRPRPGGP